MEEDPVHYYNYNTNRNKWLAQNQTKGIDAVVKARLLEIKRKEQEELCKRRERMAGLISEEKNRLAEDFTQQMNMNKQRARERLIKEASRLRNEQEKERQKLADEKEELRKRTNNDIFRSKLIDLHEQEIHKDRVHILEMRRADLEFNADLERQLDNLSPRFLSKSFNENDERKEVDREKNLKLAKWYKEEMARKQEQKREELKQILLQPDELETSTLPKEAEQSAESNACRAARRDELRRQFIVQIEANREAKRKDEEEEFQFSMAVLSDPQLSASERADQDRELKKERYREHENYMAYLESLRHAKMAEDRRLDCLLRDNWRNKEKLKIEREALHRRKLHFEAKEIEKNQEEMIRQKGIKRAEQQERERAEELELLKKNDYSAKESMLAQEKANRLKEYARDLKMQWEYINSMKQTKVNEVKEANILFLKNEQHYKQLIAEAESMGSEQLKLHPWRQRAMQGLSSL